MEEDGVNGGREIEMGVVSEKKDRCQRELRR